jgi:glutamyl-tRNA reductase
MVIGLNHRTAPVPVRERFWISENRRAEALTLTAQSEGVDEVIVLATCNRTEFLLWASDPTLASNSVLRFLTAEYGLKLCEWKHFYRLLDEPALVHIFQVACGLDSMLLGEPQIVSQLKKAWQLAQTTRTSGRFLDAVMQKALTVSKRVRSETAIGNSAVSVPHAAVELARRVLGTLEHKRVLVLGAGKMSELSARYLVHSGAASVAVINRTHEHAAELAAKLGGCAIPFEERLRAMVQADILISSTSCPDFVLGRNEAEIIARQRALPLLIVDIALPRDVDPAVRRVAGIFLYDLDDLERVVRKNAGERELAAAGARQIVEAEAQDFSRKLQAERVVPTIVALRHRLDEICRQELDCFKRECGPFSRDQEQMLGEVTARITRKIAGALARELKESREKVDQEQMTTAVKRLFRLEMPEQALAGSTSQNHTVGAIS